MHENVELEESAATKLFKLEPENIGNSVFLAKIYVSLRRWVEPEWLVKEPAESLNTNWVNSEEAVSQWLGA